MNNAKIIVGLKMIDVESLNCHEYIHATETKPFFKADNGIFLKPLEPLPIEIENVPIKSFRLPNGDNIYLGWVKEVEEFLGFPMKVFDAQAESIVDLLDTIKILERQQENNIESIRDLNLQIDKYEKMTFFERVKFIFKRRRM